MSFEAIREMINEPFVEFELINLNENRKLKLA
jgi:hypothetical protein